MIHTISEHCREAIFANFLSQAVRDAPKHSKVYAVAGIPGSGKSTFVQESIRTGRFPSNAFILNPDQVMEALPEYWRTYNTQGAEQAFQAWELPARELAYALLEAAIELHTDIIIDMGAARPEHVELLRRLKLNNYSVNMYWLDVSVETARSRINSRSRFTPESMSYERKIALEALKPDYTVLADVFVES